MTDDDPDAHEEVPGRSSFRLAVVIAVSLLLAVGVVVAYNLGRGKTLLGAEPEPENTPSSTSGSGEGDGEGGGLSPIKGTTATDFDPQGETPEENPEQAPLAVDGDPATAWRTSTYFDQFGPPAGLKTGVGLVIDLGESQEVAQIDLTTVGTPTEVTYYLTDQPPTAIAGLDPLDSTTASSTQTRTRLDDPATGQYLVVWLTALPPAGADFRGEIAEVVVSG